VATYIIIWSLSVLSPIPTSATQCKFGCKR